MRSIVNNLSKVKEYFNAFVDLLKERVKVNKLRRDPGVLIQSLRRQGVRIEDDEIILSPETLNIDLTRPSLIKIGGGLCFIKI